MGFAVVRREDLAWETRPHEAGEPARHVAELSERIGLAHTRANIWRYEPGATGLRHTHPFQEETFVVLSGALTMYLGEPPAAYEVPVGGVVHVEPGTALQTANHGAVDLLVFAYGTPPEEEHAHLLESAARGIRLRPVSELTIESTSAVERFRAEIADVLADAEVHHIGATALGSGLTKGDVDVNVRVASAGFDEAVSALRARYEVAQPENWTDGFASFSAADYPMPFGIQLTAIGSTDDYLLALRDRMRADPDLLRRYDACKQATAAGGPEAYWEAKNAFLQRLLAEPDAPG